MRLPVASASKIALDAVDNNRCPAIERELRRSPVRRRTKPSMPRPFAFLLAEEWETSTRNTPHSLRVILGCEVRSELRGRVNTSCNAQREDPSGSFEVFRRTLGFVPGILRAQVLLPRVIDAQAGLEGAIRLREGKVSRLHKERILLTVANDRKDACGIAEHCAVLASLGEPDSLIVDLLIDLSRADLSTPDLASLRFCRKLIRSAHAVSREDIELLRAIGLPDESIFETAVVAALGVYRCTLSVGLRSEPDFPFREISPSGIGWTADPTSDVPQSANQAAHERKGPYLPAPYLSPDRFTPFATLYKSHGFIPNFFRAQTLRPDLLQAEIEAVEKILMPEDALSRVQKECILLAVSAANLNSYCVAIHSNLLRGMGVPAEEGDQIAVDHHWATLSDADKALVDFSIRLGTRPSEFSADDVAELRKIGFNESQILEGVVVTAFNNFANFLQMGLGFEPDFEPPVAFQQVVVKPSSPAGSLMSGDSAIPTLTTAIVDPDANLVLEAQAGDLEAFEQLVRRHTQPVYRTLIAILGNASDAQDAMQDVFLNAFKHIGSFERRSKISTWLASIARHAALQRIRRLKDTESLDSVECGEDREFRPRQVRAWQDDPEQSYSNAQRRKLVERGILQLSAKYRLVVMLRDIEQLSTDEVARRLGLSVPNVKTRLFRGRLMLREWLSPYFSKDPRGAAE
jgi:RNA polymerase sigma-70 factor (ECF subfamily)